MTAMTIVTYVHRPKRQRRSKAQPATATSPAIVTAAGKHRRKPATKPKDDPEADERVRAWFARNIRPPGA
jgi:hypothetical protein